MNFKEFYRRLLTEAKKLPKGFTDEDIESIEDFLISNETIKEAEGDPEISDIDIDALKQQRLEPPKEKGRDIASKPEKMLHKSNIIDENGNLIDNDTLRKQIMIRPKSLIGQNDKLAKSKPDQMFYDLTLPSYQGLYIDETTGDFKVIKTCPSAGECKKFCYAAKGGFVMFPASSMGASRTVNYLMNDPDGFKAQLLSELKRAVASNAKKGKKVILRWHDSGDFLSEKYLLLAYDVAKETPDILHYAYTKQVPMVRKLAEHKPDNFIFNYSLGGLHDELIDLTKEKHARVVPYELFKDIPYTKGEDGYSIIFAPEQIKEIKKKLSEYYKIPENAIVTYDELIDMPEDTNKMKYCIVHKGHGDVAATRRDVLGTLLFFH